jgi:hypothetical protein
MGFYDGPSIVNNGLILSLDAADKNSYIGSGTLWNDLSGTTISGSFVNTPTFDSNNQGSIVFNGTNQYINLQTGSYLTGSSTQITIEIWNSGSIAQASAVFSAAVGSTRNISITMPWSDSIIYWDCGNSGVTYDRINTAALSTSQYVGWHHWVFTKNTTAGTMEIYLDGNLNTSGTGKTLTINIPSTASIAVLREGAVLNYHRGKIANIKIYNRVLSADEIFQNYNAQKSRFGL